MTNGNMNEIWQASEFFKETENSSVYKLPSFSDGRSFLVWERGSLSIFCYCDIERGELFMPLFLTLLCQGWLHRPLMGAHLRFLLSLCLLKVMACRPPSLLVSHQAFLCLSIRMCGKGGEMDVTDWFCCGCKYSIKGNLFAVLRGRNWKSKVHKCTFPVPPPGHH